MKIFLKIFHGKWGKSFRKLVEKFVLARKRHPPLTLIKIIALCIEQGIPGSVLQIITGSGEFIGKILAESPKVNAISLTGSTEVGVSLAEIGAKTLKRVFLELGGNDPLIVLEDAVKFANASRYGLQAGIMSKSVERAMRVAANLQCGAVVINGSGNYRHIEQPFGGYKMSGVGREGISGTLAEMTQEKTYVLKNVL
nr:MULTISPECIES: aldehyde dehydrogenase family protein [unclassified Fibrobacter]